jgi:hypothetical protein
MGNYIHKVKSEDQMRAETLAGAFHGRLGQDSPVSIIGQPLVKQLFMKLAVQRPPVAVISCLTSPYPHHYGALIVFSPSAVIELMLPPPPFSDANQHRSQKILLHTGQNIVIMSSVHDGDCRATTISIFKCHYINEQPTLTNSFSYYGDYPQPCASNNWVVFVSNHEYHAINLHSGIHYQGQCPSQHISQIKCLPSETDKFVFVGQESFIVSFTTIDDQIVAIHIGKYSFIIGNWVVFVGYDDNQSLYIQTMELVSGTKKYLKIIKRTDPGYLLGNTVRMGFAKSPNLAITCLSETEFCLAEEREKQFLCEISYEYDKIFMWHIDSDGTPILMHQLLHYPRWTKYLNGYMIEQVEYKHHALLITETTTKQSISIPLIHEAPHFTINGECDMLLTNFFNYEWL